MKNKILFISPQFYGYWSLIKKGLERENCNVDVILYPSSWLYKVFSMVGIFEAFKEKYVNLYFARKIKKLADAYDIVFIIKPSSIPEEYMNAIKVKYGTSKFVAYYWDDVKFDSKSKDIAGLFDKVLSYSLEDCRQYGYIYRPMFYNDMVDYRVSEKPIDLYYVGSYEEPRFRLLVKLLNKFDKSVVCCKFVLRCGWFLRLATPEHYTYWSLFRNKNVPYEEMMKTLCLSKCSIEIPHSGQYGLTTRPIESLATHTKIVTTNESIVDDPIYNPSNCWVIDIDDPTIDAEWLRISFQELDEEKMRFYSLKQFVIDILN